MLNFLTILLLHVRWKIPHAQTSSTMRTSLSNLGPKVFDDVGRGSSWLGITFIKAGPTKSILRIQSSNLTIELWGRSLGVVFVIRGKLKVPETVNYHRTRRSSSKHLWSAARGWRCRERDNKCQEALSYSMSGYYHDPRWHLFAGQFTHRMFPTRANSKTLNGKHNLYSPCPCQLQTGFLRSSTTYTSSSKRHIVSEGLSSRWTKEIALFGLQNSWYLHNFLSQRWDA